MAAPHRAERIEKELVRELSRIILYELNDPRRGFVTVVRTKLSPDFKQAKVFVSIMGQEKEKKLTFHGLQHARGFIQKAIGNRMKSLRFVPELIFELDQSIEKSFRISGILDRLDEERRARGGGGEEE